MTSIFENYTIPIIVALLIGLLIGWWMFKRDRAAGGTDIAAHPEAETIEAPRPEPVQPAAPVADERPARRAVDGPEGNGIADQGAAAASDVAGELLGVRAHGELPGADGPPDNLSIMKGVGPKLVTRLNENGITRFEQLARLSDNEAAILDDKLGPFKGRLQRDRVIEQAHYLARGDRDGFEATFGNLGSGS